MDYNEIDNKIAEISKKVKVLSAIKPVNLNEERNRFIEDNTHNPIFEYRELSFDPDEVRKELQDIKFDNSVICRILKAKKEEILNEINLCESIGKENFTEMSIIRHGKPDSEVISKATQELQGAEFEKEEYIIDTSKAKEILEARFEQYGLDWKVKLKDVLPTEVTAGKENSVLLRKGILASKQRMMTMIRHEIDCHILKAENGKFQPYKIFNRGFPNYLETEEGQGIYMANQLGLKTRKIFFPQMRVILTDIALKGSFSDMAKETKKYGFRDEEILNLCCRIKRGLKDTSKPGAYTKDAIYYPGALMVEEFLKKNPIEELYYGKIALEFLEDIKKIEGLQKPKFLPLPLKIEFIEQFL
ncbi:flavohemoglobin expression-modulating QEGLA motif protein [Candidatus Woesearchaeota archaeon]|nr:flavohemoglobin expression-modulating QEGLA motif protein [Candidatus Woesearchaeota archaeon]